MYTNQDATPGQTTPPHACRHAPGRTDAEHCRYLRALDALRAWIGRAEQAHAGGACRREQVGELWMLQAELSYALDHCPNCSDGQGRQMADALVSARPAGVM
jgi:hypothetical protein